MKTATKKVTEETIENFNNAVELSQKTADMFLASSVQSMEISNNYFQNVVKAGLDAHIAGINITRSYFEGLAEVQKSWNMTLHPINAFERNPNHAVGRRICWL